MEGLKPAEKQIFFITLRRLSGSLGRLPDSLIIAEGIEVSSESLASSVFADLRTGKYNEYPVAVKAMRVTAQDDFLKIRKVSTDAGHSGRGLNRPAPAILQGSSSLEHTISPECHETRWSLWGHG